MSGLKNLLREANGVPTGSKNRKTQDRTQNSLLYFRDNASKSKNTYIRPEDPS
jgi:hypothetical protein